MTYGIHAVEDKTKKTKIGLKSKRKLGENFWGRGSVALTVQISPLINSRLRSNPLREIMRMLEKVLFLL